LVPEHREERVLRPVRRLGLAAQLLHLAARQHFLGHVERARENALHGTVRSVQRRIDEVEVSGLRVLRADVSRQLLAVIRLSGAHHLLEDLLEALPFRFRDRLEYGLLQEVLGLAPQTLHAAAFASSTTWFGPRRITMGLGA